jgi:hypothetical protein
VVSARDDAIDAGGHFAFDGSRRRGALARAGGMAAQRAAGPSLEFALPVDTTSPRALIAMSCSQSLPLTWGARDDDAQRALFRSLDADFELEETSLGPVRVVRLSARRPRSCGTRVDDP